MGGGSVLAGESLRPLLRGDTGGTAGTHPLAAEGPRPPPGRRGAAGERLASSVPARRPRVDVAGRSRAAGQGRAHPCTRKAPSRDRRALQAKRVLGLGPTPRGLSRLRRKMAAGRRGRLRI